MKNDVLVSVIVPVYNVCPYLTEAINSVIHQTYEHLEIIIIDDGSTDGSGSICDEFARRDERIRLIHQENKGLSCARNKGLDLMTGQAVAFLDSDDAYHLDYIERMLNTMIREGANLVICRYTRHDTGYTMPNHKNTEIRPEIKPGIYDRTNSLRSLAEDKINYACWNKLFSSELWENLRFPTKRLYEDIDTTYRIIDRCRTVCVIGDILYYYRRRAGSITNSYSLSAIEDWLLSTYNFESYIRTNTPDVFSIKQLNKFRKSRLKRMIIYYALYSNKDSEAGKVFFEDLKRQIVENVNDSEVINGSILISVCNWMICNCPWLLKFVYPSYHCIRHSMMRLVDVCVLLTASAIKKNCRG